MSGDSPTLARSIGRFFGHVVSAVRPRLRTAGETRVVRVDREEKTVQTPSGPLVLRRTTIDEVCRPDGEGSR
ncbi:MAG: hypothetical protein FJ255_10635 [Phycisphaerae bacterium]|nr:hypothetical protein [Phycisphaerae bacterium]